MASERKRAGWGLPPLLAHTIIAFGLVPVWTMTRCSLRRKRLEAHFFRGLLRATGIRTIVDPFTEIVPGTLFVANHISFTDIFALALTLDARFVAKADVNGWPLIGWLARRFGTIFVERNQSMAVPGQIDEIGNCLKRGENVILFPEGTTSHGYGVLPFRTSLMAAAAHAAAVRPVALAYIEGPPRGYVGSETLIANLVRLAAYGSVLRISIMVDLASGIDLDRKALAAALRGRIGEELGRMRAAAAV